MGTFNATSSISAALFGKTQCALLALLFGRPEQTFYLRQIVRVTGIGQGAAQRELARWAEAGLLRRTHRGNQVHYQADPESAVFAELKALTMKTSGLADVICDALAPLVGRIKVAFVHGSIAAGTETAASDIDVVVVGKASFADVAGVLQPAERKLGREINPTVYGEKEFREKLQAGNHFLRTLMARPLLLLVGTRRDLEELGP